MIPRNPAVLALALTLCAGVMPALAADNHEMLDCWTGNAELSPPSSSVEGNIDAILPYGTSQSDWTQATGFGFSDDDDYQMFCTWLVPDDYHSNAGASPPVVHLRGWLFDARSCGGGCATNYLRMCVQSRRYQSGNMANAAWSGGACEEEAIGTGMCGYPSGTYWCGEILLSMDIAPESAANNWAAGDLVFFRISRDITPVGGTNVSMLFALTGASIEYPNP